MSENGIKREVSSSSVVPYTIFTGRQKAVIVALVSIAATFTAFSSNIYFPAIPKIASALQVSNEDITLTVTTYMMFQGLSPSLWGAVSDVYGRRITYICTFVVYLGACIGLAETKHYYQLVILRCMQSSGSASTVAIGSGVIGDITKREERGGYMGIFMTGLLAPLSIGPILGGVLAETLGWKSIFWFLTIYAGVFLVLLILVLPETLRSIVGNGSVPAKDLADSPLAAYQRRRNPPADEKVQGLTNKSPKKTQHLDLLGPFRMLFIKDISFLIIYLSIFYTVWQMTVAALSTLFKNNYGLSEIQIGLTFIANGTGCMIGTLLTGKLLDKDYARVKKNYTGKPARFPLERARLPQCTYYALLEIASTLVFGWTLDKKVHISVPIIATFFIGWAATSIQSVIQTFIVDVYHKRSASATAAMNLARCLAGAGGTAAVLPLTNAINVGWTFTLCAALMIASMGLLIMQMAYGLKWRLQREEKEQAK